MAAIGPASDSCAQPGTPSAEASHTGKVPRQTSTFALEHSVLRRTFIDGNVTRHPESHFLDFIVDGESLSARMKASGDLATS